MKAKATKTCLKRKDARGLNINQNGLLGVGENKLPRPLKPRPYLDTNVILDYIRDRNKDSVYLLETIRRKRIKSYTTIYTLLELIDHQQEDKWIEKRVSAKESFEEVARAKLKGGLTITLKTVKEILKET